MREDMKHVIIDRPRIGGDGGRSAPPKGSYRRWQRIALEDRPRTESSFRARLYGHDCKHLNEHLAPLRRWLRSNCGRPWNEVYAEICQNLRVDNATQAHVRDHADKFVLKDTRLEGGRVCDSKGRPVTGWRWQPFYVDPRDGTLRESPPLTRYQHEAKGKDCVEGKDYRHQYRLVNGIWYEVEIVGYPSGPERRVRDVVLGTYPTRQEAYQFYGMPVYAR